MPVITILHTSDIHGKLYEARAKKIGELKSSSENPLLLDSGDAIASGNLGFRPGGEPVLRLMSKIGYDAMTLGNRETHLFKSIQKLKIRNANFPILCANLVSHIEFPLIKPYIVKEIAGVRIQIIGLTVPMFTKDMWCIKFTPFEFKDPIECAWRAVDEVDCDYRIALTHIGFENDRRLAQAVPKINMILGGHSHTPTKNPELINNISIFHSPPYAESVLCIQLKTGSLSVYAYTRVELNSDS